MKKLFPILAVAVILFMTATFAHSQLVGRERVRFKRGARSAIVTGNFGGYKDRKIFVVGARRGQTLSVEQIRSNSSNRYVTLVIKAPNGEDVTDSDASCNNRKLVKPTVAGYYRIEVKECQKADAWRGSFRLKVTVK
jgi:hypothetical protein